MSLPAVKKSRNSKCFVPTCSSGYKSCNVKVSMFKAPGDPKRLSEWERNIRRTDRRLTKNCTVCALHFEPCFIEHSYKHIINGQVVEIPRGIPKLTNDAVPTLFPGAPAYFNKRLPVKRKERNLCDQPPPKLKKRCKIKATRENVDLEVEHTRENLDVDDNLAAAANVVDSYHALELPKKWSSLDVLGLPNTFHYGCCKFKSAEDCSKLTISKLVRVVQQLDGSAVCTTFVRGIVESTTTVTTAEEAKELLMRADKLKLCVGCNVQPSGRAEYLEFDDAYYSKNCTLVSKEKALCLHCKYLRALVFKQNYRKKLQTQKSECKLQKRHYEAKKALRTKRVLEKTQETLKEMKLENKQLRIILAKYQKTCFKAVSTQSISNTDEFV